MASGKSTHKVAIKFKPDHSLIKAYAVSGKSVGKLQTNKVTTMNHIGHEMRQLKVSTA